MDETPLFAFIDAEGNDIRDRIISSKVKDLSKFVTQDLNKKDIASVWVIGNDIDDYREVREFWSFQSDESMKEYIETFVKEYNTKAKEQKKISEENTKLQKKFLSALKKYDAGEFIIAENDIGAYFDTPASLTPTRHLPVMKTANELKLWREFRDIEIIELFNQLNVDADKTIFMDVNKNEGVLDSNLGYIEFSSDPEKIASTQTKIEESLGKKLNNVRKEKIKGEFVIKDKFIDRRLFALFIVLKKFYKNRIMLDETGKVLSGKDRFTLKYYHNTFSYSSPIFVTLTNYGDDVVVKMAKVPSEAMIRTVKIFVLGMLFEYESEITRLTKMYTEVDKSLSFTSEDIEKQKKKPTTQATKTKQKLGPLQEKNPELFGFKGYARLCPASDQPKIPPLEKVKKLLKNDPSKIIEYPEGSGDYYTCDHIKTIKKGESKLRIYPGLRPDTESVKVGRETKYKYVPCCYPIDQYKKASSGLNKYRQVPTKAVPKKSEGILDKQKKLGEGRKGFIPTTLAEIMIFHGLKPDDYLRYGLPPSKQSIIDAAAMIKFSDMDFEEARDQVLFELQSSNSLYAGLQSYSMEYMINALEDDSIELKAIDFLPVLEYYLRAVVVLIEGDDMPIPNTKLGFIPTTFMRKRFVLLYKHKDSEQIEVVGTYQKEFDSYASQKVVQRFLRTKLKVYGFFSESMYKYPKYLDLVARAQGQYIDTFGKCRGFLIDGQSVFMAPVAPVNKPVVTEISVRKPMKLIKSLKLDPLYEDDVALYTEKFVFVKSKSKDYGYSEPPSDYMKPYVIPQNTFFIPSYRAENDAITLMNGYDVEIDKETEKVLSEWEDLNVEPPRQNVSLDAINTVVTLHNKGETRDYIQLLRTRGKLEWEKLENLKHVPGVVHNVLLDDTETLEVLDVEKKPKEIPTDKGLYDVSYGRKVEDGPGLVAYPHGKWGVVLR